MSIPASPWVIASGLASASDPQGALYLIDRRDGTWRVLYPSEGMRERGTRQEGASTSAVIGDADCQAPVDPTRFSAHGLSVRSHSAYAHLVYVVNHGERESIELFEFNDRASPPSIAWRGCLRLPAQAVGNAVVALADGAIALTVAYQADDARAGEKIRRGEPTGYVLEWHPGRGWHQVPGSEGSFPNGIEASADAKWLYVSYTGSRQLVRLSRGAGPIEKDVIPVEMLADNLRWNGGELWLTGQLTPCPDLQARICTSAYEILRIDPASLKVSALLQPPSTLEFGAGTTALRIGNEVWVGTYLGDRIARFALPKPFPSL